MKIVKSAIFVAVPVRKKATARLLRVDSGTVRRINKRSGQHGRRFHDEKVQDIQARNLQADERHGFVKEKTRLSWEAELIDIESKFVISHVQGVRDEALIRELLQDSVSRLTNPQDIALFTDGDAKYARVFPETFAQAYRPAQKGKPGRFPKPQYRIPHTWNGGRPPFTTFLANIALCEKSCLCRRVKKSVDNEPRLWRWG